MQYTEDGTRVNAVCPGRIHTRMTETWKGDPVMPPSPFGKSIRRLGAPAETAIVLWMCRAEALIVTGGASPADGALTATFGAPPFVYRALSLLI